MPGSNSVDAKSGGVFFSGKPVIRQAMELADAAMAKSLEERLKMPLCTDPSDVEEDEEDEEMEVRYFSLDTGVVLVTNKMAPLQHDGYMNRRTHISLISYI